MIALKPHLEGFELEAGYKTAADAVAKSHFHALWLASEGYAIDEIAELLSFSPRWVQALIKRYNERGPEALGDQRARNGAPRRILTPAALEGLRKRISAPPPDGGLWSGPKIARWLAQFHGLKSVHDQRGWDALVAIGYSVQKPRPRHPQAATAQDRAALKKSSRRRWRANGAAIRRLSSNSGAWTSTGSA